MSLTEAMISPLWWSATTIAAGSPPGRVPTFGVTRHAQNSVHFALATTITDTALLFDQVVGPDMRDQRDERLCVGVGIVTEFAEPQPVMHTRLGRLAGQDADRAAQVQRPAGVPDQVAHSAEQMEPERPERPEHHQIAEP